MNEEEDSLEIEVNCLHVNEQYELSDGDYNISIFYL